MDPSSPEVIKAVHVLTSRSAFALSTWPAGQHRVDKQDVAAALAYAERVHPDQLPGDADPEDELELLALRGDLFRDGRTGNLFATSHVSESVFRLCADNFFTATGGRFGSLTEFGDDLPDWAVPLGQGQTVRVGYSERSPDPQYKDLLIGLDDLEQATWVLTAG